MKETETTKEIMDEIKVGDLVLVHGFVATVVAKMGDLGFIYETSAGERIAYNAKWPINPEPQRIWILEQ